MNNKIIEFELCKAIGCKERPNCGRTLKGEILACFDNIPRTEKEE